MALLERPGTGRVAVLEKPPEATTDTEVAEDSGLGTLKSSLTVIKNPSLDGYLGILMAANTLLHEDDSKSFFHVYVLRAYGDIVDTNVLHADIAKSENVQKSGNSPLYVVSFHEGGRYPVASQLPHEICKITDEEFRSFEATLTSPNQRVVGLTGLVNNMTQLIGQRVNTFSLDNGKLVLPPNYANTRL